MSENLDTTGTAVQGKQMGIAGFVLALVTLVLAGWIWVLAVAAVVTGGSPWLMYLWLVLAIVSVVLSAMAMGKLKKTGGKRGLAIAGLVIGIVSVVYSITLTMTVAAAGSVSGELKNVDWDQVTKDMQKDLNNAQ